MPHIDEYKTIVKLEQLNYLLDDLHYELTNEEKTECMDIIKISDMVWNAKRRKEEEVYAMEENEKTDAKVYIVVRKIINNNREEIIMNEFNECFTEYREAVHYVINHFKAHRCKKEDRFETEDFVYEIKEISVVKEYLEESDQIILRGEE